MLLLKSTIYTLWLTSAVTPCITPNVAAVAMPPSPPWVPVVYVLSVPAMVLIMPSGVIFLTL